MVCCIFHLSSRKGLSSLSGSFSLRPFLNGVALLFHFMSTPQTAAHVVSDFCDVAGPVASGTMLPPYSGAVGSITWLLGYLASLTDACVCVCCVYMATWLHGSMFFLGVCASLGTDRIETEETTARGGVIRKSGLHGLSGLHMEEK